MKNVFRLSIVLLTLFCVTLPARSQDRERDEGKSHLFQVVLLIGDSGGNSELEGVSGNVEKALADVREFLPFKSYRVLDTALLRSAGRVQGLLSGPAGQDYRLEMVFDGKSAENRINVHGFGLTDLGIRETPSPPPGGSRGDSGSAGAAAPRATVQRTLIESSFSMDVGETIIVGSSKLNGGSEALLVLLTAIP